MALPKVVIIGRPNVGKSTLFNRLVGKRIALVDDTPGVTRDRREGEADLSDLHFIAVDTAGLEEAGPETLSGRMRQQTEAALGDAAAALLVIDARAGLTPLDRHFADWMRGQKVPLVLVANKAEGSAADPGLYEAFELGLGESVAISAEHGVGMADLYEALAPHLDALAAEEEEGDEEEGPLRLAIVGRPNAGKSTLINKILEEERLVTGPEAGITRDSIEIEWSFEGRDVRLIDTAGVRKRAKVQDKLERLSVADTRRAIDFAEVVIILLDATKGLEAQDLRIADQVLQEGRALIMCLSKWDAAEDQSRLFNGVRAALADGLSQISGVPLLTVSGLSGKGIDTLIKVAFEQRDAWSRRVSTGQLNRWFENAQETNPPPAPKGRRIKMRYITQAKTRPPTFIVFGNRLEALPASYQRYLVNSLRQEFGLEGVPLRLNLRSKANPFD
ncbi:ribosome biogenesis GTPase Der [Pacificimonas flava]|uniref:GTPase Der n=2 Tax=Pacificimonas TaxID=1960290 RepID=A0A219B504_9SPHN|nr:MULTISPECIES: ribosome biogenesis GTPase Der [Pacificimonas]MBZ6379334.1 ribosome biogenesis GTPase Der [Pacificimonas aurantium]OWV33462.1 ribosome biogenesis GTPase Der [Pacificimonas flava]